MNGMKPLKTREAYERELKTSRMNLLIVAILSIVNVVVVLFGGSYFFYFSASVPFYLSIYFAELCGMRSEAFYEEFYGPNWKTEYLFEDASVFYVVAVIAVILAALYLLFWFLSKKNRTWSIVALVYYALDAVGHLYFALFVYGFAVSDLIALAFHAWVLYYLYLAIRAWNQMPDAPTEADLAAMNHAPNGAPNAPFYGDLPLEGTATPVETDAPSEEAPTEAPVQEETTTETPTENGEGDKAE